MKYDLEHPQPIRYEDIRPGMIIMHHDPESHRGFYIGETHKHLKASGQWYDEDDCVVADDTCENFIIYKKLPDNPQTKLRILMSKNMFTAGDVYTKSIDGLWFRDGSDDCRTDDDMRRAEWEEVSVISKNSY